MREVRFRAWDKTNNEWYMNGDTFDLNYSGGYGDFFFDNDHPCNMRDVELEWEQSTGLCDKNGEDLDWWEGDIFDHLGHKGLIEWYEGGLFYHDQGGYCPIGEVLVWAVIPTKIGTVHENPELLERQE